MAKIEATIKTQFTVRVDPVAAFRMLADPKALSGLVVGLERWTEVKSDTIRWELEEKRDKGIVFKADYTIEYSNNGADALSWRSVAGNMDCEGEIRVGAMPGGTSVVDYWERVAPDIPVTPLLAKLIKPIVRKELVADVTEYVARLQRRLETVHSYRQTLRARCSRRPSNKSGGASGL